MNLHSEIEDLLERREFPRHAYTRTVSVSLARWSTLEVMSHDISAGGIRLALPIGVTAGDQVTVGLTLPNELQISLAAEVRFVGQGTRPGECVAGLRWLDSHGEDAVLLNEVIADLKTGGDA
ncbi:MAG: PilZ domain-containing protein [Deltaproteobacteria bacterium]|nr:PilZ domain-containing protein [Deltaproteobacteria bacterium]